MIYCSFHTNIQREEDCDSLMDITDKIEELLLGAQGLNAFKFTIRTI